MKHLILIAALLTSPAQADTLKLAVTTSFENAGLAEVLLPEIAADTGIDVQLLVVGTGQALRLGEAGDVDAILVHAKSAEEAFIAAGHATHRREIMHNDFVLIGPGSDPANVRGRDSATQALGAIAEAEAPFVSRGDESGTHKAEVALWQAISRDPATFGGWYKATGSGMGAALNTATGLNAYILADRATWLKHGNKGDLQLLFSGDPALFNQYAYLPVNPDRHPHVQGALAEQLETWLTSPAAAALINGYTLEGEQLFTFNAR